MRFRIYFLLFCLGLVSAGGAAYFQSSPGYMDADYYLAGGMQLADGEGFQEWILWHYLDDPQDLPHPSHGYWMPLASILAFAGVRLAGGFLEVFSAARLGFLVLVALIPPLTAWLGWVLVQNRLQAILAGLLAVFPGFYWSFLATTDTFGIVMVLGLLFLVIIQVGLCGPSGGWLPRYGPLLLGILAGGMHLARADGWLWLGVGGLALLLQAKEAVADERWRGFGKSGFLLVVGYTLVMGPWFARNLVVFGSPLAPGGSRAFWLTAYDELFIYPADQLTFARWWETGLGEILEVRFWALGQNMQTAAAVQGMIYLVPLVLWGAWRMRKALAVRTGILAWGIVLGVMTFVFPFQGARGGFFHSGAAVQGLVWVLSAVGLDAFLEWGRARRGWRLRQARPVFMAALVGFALLITLGINLPKLLPRGGVSPWNSSQAHYLAVERRLVDLGAARSDPVMANNPPGYFVANQRAAVVVPDTGPEGVLAVAEAYGVRFLILEPNHPENLSDLYDHPASFPDFVLLDSVDETYLFKINFPASP